MEQNERATPVAPVAWLIEYEQHGKRRAVHLHNAVGDYRDFDPCAQSTPLYASPAGAAAVPASEHKPVCKYGDQFCPCQDGDQCHYEGMAPMSPPQPVSEVVERAWLVEWSGYGYGPQWWGFNFEPKRCASWCEDANNAIRFSRKADAERIRLHILALEGTNSEDRKRSISVTEHEWHCAAHTVRSAGG